jgi:hypothetical protein
LRQKLTLAHAIVSVQRLKKDPCGMAGPFHPSGHWRSKSIWCESIVSAPDCGFIVAKSA